MQICFVKSCMHGPMGSTEHKQRGLDDWEMGPSILWVLSIRCHDQIMKCRDGPYLECWKGSIQHFRLLPILIWTCLPNQWLGLSRLRSHDHGYEAIHSSMNHGSAQYT